MSDVETAFIFKLLALQPLNSSLCTLWPILLIFVLGVIIADETKLADVVFLEDERLDMPKGLEHLSHLLLCPLERNVLDIDIVDEFPHLTAIFWLKDESLDGGSISLKSLASRFFILIANKSIPPRRMI